MARYRYSAVDREGRNASGQIEASSLDHARAQLAVLGLDPQAAALELDPEPSPNAGRISEAEAVSLGDQIAGLARASLPLGPGLRAMAEEFARGRARALLRRLADQLDAGASLDEALAAAGPGVPEHLRCLLQAAAQSGRFAEVIDEMTALERTRLEVRHRLRIAFAYPLFLVAVILVIYTGSMFLTPQFGKIYADFGAELPVATRVAMAVCSPLAVALVWTVVGLALVAGLVAFSARTRSATMQRLLYRLPIVGPMWRFRGLAEFSRLMGLLLELRAPLPQALRAAAAGLREGDLRAASLEMAAQVESGGSFSEAMARRREFPATFGPLVRWGDQSPALADAFRGLAEMCEGRLRFHGMVADGILLPLTLVLVLGFVAELVWALMLPLVSLIQKLT